MVERVLPTTYAEYFECQREDRPLPTVVKLEKGRYLLHLADAGKCVGNLRIERQDKKD